MRLYATPGACSLSPHITLRELGVPFKLERVDLATKRTGTGRDFREINPKGYVPALALDDGTVLTEGAVLVQYLADQYPERGLAPTHGTKERWRLMEIIHFIATELHKSVSPFYNPKAGDEFKASLHERMALRWRTFEAMLGDGPFLLGEQFSVADPYAYYVLRSWQVVIKGDLTAFPKLVAYYERLGARPSVVAALAAEKALGQEVVKVA